MNCWEYKGCTSKDTCQAYRKKMGNICWVAAGASGGKKPQGVFAREPGECRLCDFYKSHGPGIPTFASCSPLR
jgi:hypothetical protein